MSSKRNSIAELVDQFIDSAGETMNKLQNAVMTADQNGIKSVLSTVKNHGIVKHIGNLVQSSESKKAEFVQMASEAGENGQVLLGVYLGATGALVGANAAGLSSLLTWGLGVTASVAFIEFIAVVLLVIAGVLLFKAGLKRLKGVLDTLQEDINKAF